MTTTPFLLLHDLQEVLEEATKNLKVGDSELAPKIYIGYPPIKKPNVPNMPPGPSIPVFIPPVPNNQVLDGKNILEDKLPYIIVRYLESTDEQSDDEETTKVNVRFIFFVHSISEKGYLDIVRLQEAVRLTLLKKGIIGDAAEVQKPLSMIIHEEQFYPDWSGEGTVSFLIPTILREVNLLDY